MYLTRTNLHLPCIWNPVTTILTRNTCIAEPREARSGGGGGGGKKGRVGAGGGGGGGGGGVRINCQVWTGERIGVNVQTN